MSTSVVAVQTVRMPRGSATVSDRTVETGRDRRQKHLSGHATFGMAFLLAFTGALAVTGLIWAVS